MFRSFFAFVALMLGVSAGAAAADLRPSTDKWVVNFDAAKCFAVRNYGTKNNPRWLSLKEPARRSVIQLQWMDEGGDFSPQQFMGTIQFGEATPVPVSILAYHAKKPDLRIYEMNVPIERFDLARGATTLRLNGKDDLNEQLQLTGIESLLRTMDQCVTDLRQQWNVTDGDDSTTPNPHLLKGAKGNLAAAFSENDYPWMALMREQGGNVGFSLLIDETGKIADCSVTEPSGVASLDLTACVVLKERARLEPAIGLDGKPARSSMIGRVRWQMEP